MTRATSQASNRALEAHFKDVALAPTPAVTVDNELQALYDLLIGTGDVIDRLEAKLHPVVFPAAPLDGRGVPTEMVPPVIDRIRGMASSIALYNERLASITERLAV